MRRRFFNTEGVCLPDRHYMVDLTSRLEIIKEMIEDEKYFVINRGRQYGKTTTLAAIEKYLSDEYIILSLDFQALTTESFKTEQSFTKSFANSILRSCNNELSQEIKEKFLEFTKSEKLCPELFNCITEMCSVSKKPIVLLIDEVDQASNYQVFIDFLAQLRYFYLNRYKFPTFQSVILAGVYDIQNIKRKIRPEDEHVHNSPWNIAAKFDVDMSFSVEDISGMLSDYEKDKSTGMNIREVATEIRAYTGGYPVLVCRICQILDKELAGSEDFPTLTSAWTKYGVIEAVNRLEKEKTPLFGSLVNKLYDYPEIREIVYEILFRGGSLRYNSLEKSIQMAEMFGFIKREGTKAVIANRIFETVLYEMFLTNDEVKTLSIYNEGKNQKNKFIVGNELNMDLILEKFVESYDTIYGDQTEKFLEKDGRRLFLLFIRPIINGIGNYYVEAETRDYNRTDVIIDYKAKQYILEMKIWRGNSYNERGEEQLTDYLEYYHVNKGWMLSFSFNQNKQVGITHHNINGKEITEAVV